MSLPIVVTGLLLAGLLPQTPAQSGPADPFGRETPRGSVRGFLEAAHANNIGRAEEYFDFSAVHSDAEKARRVQILTRILDRDPQFELDHLDDSASGQLDDSLQPDLERLLTLNEGKRGTVLYLQREKQGPLNVWLVSPDTVSKLPELENALHESALERRMPGILVRIQWFGTPAWVFIALLIFALLISLISGLMSKLVLAIVGPLAERYLKEFARVRVQSFIDPLRLVLGAAVFRACLEIAPPGALLRDMILKVLALMFWIGVASVAMRIVDLIADQYITRLDVRERAMSHSVIPLITRFIKICVFCFGALAVLRSWNADITTVLAGFGVGGVAIALAAQKTIENLFGGISVISDRPVLVGDYCQFSGQSGTVEDIGLRSTKIRTVARTLVTVPNGQFSTMTLENFSRRDRFLFNPTLQLHRDTPPEKLRDAMNIIEGVIRATPKVDPTDVPVRFTKATENAFIMEVFSYVLTVDGNEFLRVQSELLLQAVEKLHAAGIELAVPMQATAKS